eukprot:6059408-Prorocentrum_lima.AAC.1
MDLEMHACRIAAENKIAAAQLEANTSTAATEATNTSRPRAELNASEIRRDAEHARLRSELQAQTA